MHTNSKRKNGREVMQKGKSGKRRKEWHHGDIEAKKWDAVQASIMEAFERAGIK